MMFLDKISSTIHRGIVTGTTPNYFRISTDQKIEINNLVQNKNLILALIPKLGIVEEAVREFNQSFQSSAAFADVKNYVMEQYQEENQLTSDLANLGKILSANDAYKNAIELMEDFNNLMKEAKFKQGRLSQAKMLLEEHGEAEQLLQKKYELLVAAKGGFATIIREYKEFVYRIVSSLYKDVKASFDVSFNKYDKKKRPLVIDLTLRGDAGEGVSEVKKCIFDYLLFHFNSIYKIMAHDSSCYNGIDPRQVSGLLKTLISLTEKNGKQAIIAINKYQINDAELIRYITEESAITLCENDNLLGFNF